MSLISFSRVTLAVLLMKRWLLTPMGDHVMSGLTRRDFARLGVSFAAFPTLSHLAEGKQVQRFALFLPGIMGSTLAQQSNTQKLELWTDSVYSNYQLLVKRPNLLRYDGNPATATGVLEASTVWSVPIVRYYSGILKLLKNHPDFSKQNALCIFPYDWRRSFLDILPDLKLRLVEQYKITYDENGAALKRPDIKIDVIGHSMGSMLCLLAVSRRLLHPENVGNLILIAPPLTGAAQIFRSVFDSVTLPFLEDWIWLTWGKEKQLAADILHDVLSSFDSTYELMPPENVPFVSFDNNKQWTHPFALVNTSDRLKFRTLPADKVAKAILTQAAVSAAIRDIPLPRERVHVLLGLGLQTDTRYSIKEFSSSIPEHRRFALVPPPTFGTGDGTVAYESSDPLGALSDKATVYLFPQVRHSVLCDDSKPVEQVAKILI